MISKLVMATNNENKLKEVREILSPLGIEVISQREAGAECEPDENGTTFAENAEIKARAVWETVNVPVIADDSGLCVDALDGRPGVFSARYAPKGEECEKLLEEMSGVPDSERTAFFECCIVLIDSGGVRSFSGSCYGKIGYQKKGANGFGYDPVFVPCEEGSSGMCFGDRTLAEMSSEEKNRISHRGRALKKFYKYLSGERSAE